MQHRAVDLTDIRFKPSRMRALRPKKVAELAESMAACGLLQPIVVRPESEGYCLIAGRHRAGDGIAESDDAPVMHDAPEAALPEETQL